MNMEQAIQVTGLCVAGAVLALTIRRGSPETALLLSICAAVTVLLAVGQALGEMLDFLKELAQRSGIPNGLLVPLYKTVGIALVVRVGAGLCTDAGESALGKVVETAGAVCALTAALPLLRTVLELMMELMA